MQETKRVKNPRKQRKMHFNAPAHLRHKLMAAPLSSELASSKGAKTLPVRKGDTVRIQRGDNKDFEGKVSRVDPRHYRIYLEGLTREKVDGTNIFLSVHPSKVQIRNLNLDDKRRKEILERKKEIEKPEKEEKIKAKPIKKVEKIEAKIEEIREEQMESPPVEEKAEAEIVKEIVPTKKVAEKETKKEAEKLPSEQKIVPKKSAAKKSISEKRATKKQERPKEEKEPVRTAAKPKAGAKKKAASKESLLKETTEKKAAAKPRAKRKISEEGGQ